MFGLIESLYKCFQHWSAAGSVYIMSDTHFEDIDCRIMNPNWIMPEQQVENLKIAHKCDTLIILGDVGNPKYFEKIKAHKVLIKGNHDVGSNLYKPYFDEIYEGVLFISEKICLSHEPIDLPFAINIHGHVHGGKHKWISKGCAHINVAADVVDYKPLNLGKMIKNGVCATTPSIHRICIDEATKKARKRG